MLLFKRLTIGEYIKRLILKRQTYRGSAHNTSLRHFKNKYKLAREGEKDKEKEEDFEKVNFSFFVREIHCNIRNLIVAPLFNELVS